MTLTNRSLFWLLLLMSIAIASDTPPPTLPRGFLEQLPLLERLSDREFDALARFAAARTRSGAGEDDDAADKGDNRED